ncbi:MAG TPA: SsrA-binding protein SmpB [Saprospiraceae bacterium]|nr:SsrA-binding protein SmpB [Saprospiraceae bacterium]
MSTVEIINRKATHLYFFIQTFEAGIKLTGTEIKSIREGKANLSDAYCAFDGQELWAYNIHISEYDQGSYQNHDPKRRRKLLLKKNELSKLERKVKEKGNTIIPYRIYFNERGFAKLEIALAGGKKSFDKRESLKEKDQQRELDRTLRIK